MLKSPTKTIALGAILSIVAFCVLLECKPVDKPNKSLATSRTEEDPLQAVATNEYSYFTEEQPKVQYYQAPQGVPAQNAQQLERTAVVQPQDVVYVTRPEQEHYYVQAKPVQEMYRTTISYQSHEQETSELLPPQLHQQQHPQQPEQQPNQIQPNGAEERSHEYPAEILYLDPARNGPREMQGPQEITIDPTSHYATQQQQQQKQQLELSDVGAMISKSSGLAATILTEVPLKDMPQNVLDKLKRDYGVKVVATRENPGANLVINCEQQSGHQQTSICANRQQANYLSHLPPYSFENTSNEANPPIHGNYEDQYSADHSNGGKPQESYNGNQNTDEVPPQGYAQPEDGSSEENSKHEFYPTREIERNPDPKGENVSPNEDQSGQPNNEDNSYPHRNSNPADEGTLEQGNGNNEKHEDSSSSHGVTEAHSGRVVGNNENDS